MAKSEVKVTYKVLNAEFNRGISEMNGKLTTLNKEFRLQQEQMKLTASNTEKLEATLNKLGAEYALAQEKTKLVAEGLKQVTQATGENSKETQTWSNKLLDAKKNEEFLKNAIEQTKSALDKERQAVSESARASQERKDKLTALKAEQDRLADSADKIRSKYDLERAALGNNAKESDLLKIKKKELAEQMENTGQQAQNLERQLEVAKAEYGESSREVDKLERELLEAKTAFQEYANEAAKAGDKIGQFSEKSKAVGEKLTSTGTKMTLGLTVPLVGIAKVSAETAADFETQMNRVGAIAGVQGTELDRLREQAIKLGADSVFSAQEVALAQENMASAGFKSNEIYDAAEGVMALAAISAGDMGLASEAAATAVRQFGLDAGQTARVADVYAKAAADTNAETADMAEAMKYAGPVAGTLGLSLEDTAAAIGTMSDAGIKGSQAGTTLRTMLTNLNPQSKKAAKAIEEYGLSFHNSNGSVKSMKELIAELEKGLGGLNQAEKADVIKKIFGKEAMSGVLAMLDQGSEKVGKLTSSFQESQGSAKTMADEINSGLNGALSDMEGSLETAKIKLGDALAPAIKAVADVIGDLADGFSKLDPGTQSFIAVAGMIVAAIGPVLIIFGQLATAIGSIAGLFGAGGALAGVIPWITGTLLPALGTIVSAIFSWPVLIGAALVGLVALVVTHWDQIVAWVGQAWENIKAFFAPMGEWFGQKWQEVKDKTAEIWEGLTTWLSEKWTAFIEGAGAIWETLKNVFIFAWLAIQEIFNIAWLAIETPLRLAWEIFWAFTQEFWLGIANWFSETWLAIKEAFTSAWQAVVDFVTPIWESMKAKAEEIFSALSKFFSETWASVSAAAKSAWETLTGFLSGIWSGLSEKASSIWSGIKSMVSAKWQEISAATSRIWSEIKAKVGEVWSSMTSGISQKINSIKSSVTSGFEGAKQQAVSIFDSIKSRITSAINGARDAVGNAIGRMKSFFNFSWSLPPIRLPHISISGKFSLNPPSVPHFGISWHREGGVMMNPVAFGRNGNNIMVGGEAGPEAILPLTPKVLGAIGRAQAAASGLGAGQEVTIHNTVNMTAQVDGDYGSDRLFNRVDKWLADKASLRQFAVSGSN